MQSIENILAFSAGKEIQVDGEAVKGKKRNFLETVELQISECTPAAELRCLSGLQRMAGRGPAPRTLPVP